MSRYTGECVDGIDEKGWEREMDKPMGASMRARRQRTWASRRSGFQGLVRRTAAEMLEDWGLPLEAAARLHALHLASIAMDAEDAFQAGCAEACAPVRGGA